MSTESTTADTNRGSAEGIVSVERILDRITEALDEAGEISHNIGERGALALVLSMASGLTSCLDLAMIELARLAIIQSSKD